MDLLYNTLNQFPNQPKILCWNAKIDDFLGQ
jgi:hypothetical protein